MNGSEGFVRMRTLQVVVLLIFVLLLGRLAYIQLFDSRYDEMALVNVLRPEVQYPPRGEVYDRNGEYLVQSRECYDLMVVYHDLDRAGFDTMRLCNIVGISRQKLERELASARVYPRAPRLVTNYISKEETALRRVQLPRFLHRLPHGPPLPAADRRQPAGLCGRGDAQHAQALPLLQGG